MASLLDNLVQRSVKGSPLTATDHDNNLINIANFVDQVYYAGPVRYSVRVVATSNVSVSSPPASIDGVTLSVGDRVLLTNQTSPTNNGIYVLTNEPALQKTDDWLLPAHKTSGTLIFVREGTTYGKTLWLYVGSNIFNVWNPVQVQGSSGPVYSDARKLRFTNGTVTPTGGGGYDINISATLPAIGLTFTAYVDTINGSDTTGVIHDITHPFQSVNGMLGALTSIDATINGGNAYSLVVYINTDASTTVLVDLSTYSGVNLTHLELCLLQRPSVVSVLHRGTETFSSTLTQAFEDANVSYSINLLQLDGPSSMDRYVTLTRVSNASISVSFTGIDSGFLRSYLFHDCRNISLLLSSVTTGTHGSSYAFVGCTNVAILRNMNSSSPYSDTFLFDSCTDAVLDLSYGLDTSYTLTQLVYIEFSGCSNVTVKNSNMVGPDDAFQNKFVTIQMNAHQTSFSQLRNVINTNLQGCSALGFESVVYGGNITDTYLRCSSSVFVGSVIFTDVTFDCYSTPWSLFFSCDPSPGFSGCTFVNVGPNNKAVFYVGPSNIDLRSCSFEKVYLNTYTDFVLSDVVLFLTTLADAQTYLPSISGLTSTGSWFVRFLRNGSVTNVDFASLQSSNALLYEDNTLYLVGTKVKKVGNKTGTLLSAAGMVVEDYNIFRGLRPSDVPNYLSFATLSSSKICTTFLNSQTFSTLSGDLTLVSFFVLPVPIKVTKVTVQASGFVTAGTVQVGIYSVDNLLQGSLVVSYSIPITGNGDMSFIPLSPTYLPPGGYYVLITSDGGSTGNFSIVTVSSGQYLGIIFDDTETPVNGTLSAVYTSTLPSTFSPINQLITPRAYIRLTYQDGI